MKKSHRIARKGDTARTRAQVQQVHARSTARTPAEAEIEAAFANLPENSEVEWLGWVDLPEPVTGQDGRKWIAPPPFTPVPEGHRMFAIDEDLRGTRLVKGDVAFVVEGLEPQPDTLAFARPYHGEPLFVWASAPGEPIQRSLDAANPLGTIDRGELRSLWAVECVQSFPNAPERVAERLRQMENI